MASNLKMLQIAYDKKPKPKSRAIRDIVGKLKEEAPPSLNMQTSEEVESDLELMEELTPAQKASRKRRKILDI